MDHDNVVSLRRPGHRAEDPLTEVLRHGARMLLAQAIETEEIFENLTHARHRLEHWRLDSNHVRPHSAHAGLPPAQARRLAGGARLGLVDGSAERPLAPSSDPAITHPDSPHDRGTSGEQVTPSTASTTTSAFGLPGRSAESGAYPLNPRLLPFAILGEKLQFFCAFCPDAPATPG
jgi:hypothetical protein